MSPTALGMCPNAKAVGTGAPFSQSQMYNAMIHPLLNLAPAGVLWHQGEENSGNPVEYHCFFTAMINDWRAQFKMPTLPFVFVQLQPCGIPPAQRYAQAAALVLPNVAMAVAVDLQDAGPAHIAPCPGFNQTPACGNPNGMCHTRWKQDVASRLVAAAARLIFNSTQLASVENTIPPLSPSIGDFVGMAAKDYRTYEVVFSAENVDPRLPSIGVGGTRECSLCCNPPSFAIEYTSDAPGEHWQALGTTPDKHGVPFTYNPRTRQMTFIVVVQPPWRYVAIYLHDLLLVCVFRCAAYSPTLRGVVRLQAVKVSSRVVRRTAMYPLRVGQSWRNAIRPLQCHYPSQPHHVRYGIFLLALPNRRIVPLCDGVVSTMVCNI